MPVQNVYSPQFQTTNKMDEMSDQWAGTNKAQVKDLMNQYELNKATNINKYSWNTQGMVAAGINPLMNTGDLGSMSSGGTVPISDSGPTISQKNKRAVIQAIGSIIGGVAKLL